MEDEREATRIRYRIHTTSIHVSISVGFWELDLRRHFCLGHLYIVLRQLDPRNVFDKRQRM